MGVKGLWSLLNPVSRPVQIESMEGKRLAIDSSIWLYQFQATMRDKDGRVLVNAHVLGFLRRINKLLFHGIKPVFVFDGGAPVLKRATIAERKRRKAGAAANHAKMAEKLFAAQMRREAVKVAQAQKDRQEARDSAASAAVASRYEDEAGEQISENPVYLEDLEGRPGVSSRPPIRPVPSASSSRLSNPTPAETPDPAEERRKKFKKHDPYRLPETAMPTVSTEDKPDARLATEEELQQFINGMHPEDIDVESAEFRALPTEVQYEIIGDLRIRSRAQSHKRLSDMLRAAPTPLDFSKAQIRHLSQRNALTQQLLTVTDMVGKAHLTIPVRIAAERNREYVLVKRGEDAGGGWALGIREGTKQKPIEVEPDAKSDEDESEKETETEDESDDDIKEVTSVSAPVDQDLKEYRRKEILEAIAARYAPKKPVRAPLDLPVSSFGKRRRPDAAPLFASEEDELEAVVPTANDEALALALQQEELGSDEEEADADLARALALSRRDAGRAKSTAKSPSPQPQQGSDDSDDSFEEVSLVPSERSTPQILSEAHTPEPIDVDDIDTDRQIKAQLPKRAKLSDQVTSTNALKAVDAALRKEQEPKYIPVSSTKRERSTPARQTSSKLTPSLPVPAPSREPIVIDDDEEEEEDKPSGPAHQSQSSVKSPVDGRVATNGVAPISRPTASSSDTSKAATAAVNATLRREAAAQPPPSARVTGIQAPDEIHVESTPTTGAGRPGIAPLLSANSNVKAPERGRYFQPSRTVSTETIESAEEQADESLSRRQPLPASDDEGEDVDDSRSIEWSRSPSPRAVGRPPLQLEKSASSIPSEVEDDDVDMAPADMVEETDDYARFIASIKNRDLNEVRTEIDDEIRILNNQTKVALRDSDEITQAMVAQIQTLLRHFGIPYITAPMEAEAQCAKLAELGLVDGIITDDSDVFLFGGAQCFKNIFNDAKYAECFLLTDIERELSLSRERLISLAYLLGSDYTIGLPGVGPVVALELLADFPGPNGVENFKTWWMKVQRGQDTEAETSSKWRKSFKKRYSHVIYLTADWPNPLVREAYIYPETDQSEESFHWGFPKLAALRSYLHEELSWSISKVDDELTPIVQRIARRGKLGALNKQATLDPFFDLSAGQGNYAPRRRTTANVSKRLLAVIKQFREAEARVQGQQVEGWDVMMQDLDEEDPKGRGTGKRRKSSSVLEEVKDGQDDKDDEAVPVKRKRLAVPRKRKSTMDSISVASEGGTESVGSSAGTDEGRGRRAGRSSSLSRGRGRGRGRGKGKGVAMAAEGVEIADA
ncbi:hypothetical protein BCR39DRAFT_554229 [Naematelia encephala]|uniref:PIN domain-like protein n=1 Tax=Naematelia encephala TaxID=71784 RepID=A0A1Y2AEU3_9TREE|nr:hypothetical protein BCR39DRAFT_554229 [Naematelia encephala]